LECSGVTRAIVSGALHGATQERVSKNDNAFCTFTVTEKVNGSTRWWKGVAFNKDVIDALKDLSAGSLVALAGEIDCEVWSPDDGRPPRLTWKITVDGLLTARKPYKAPSGRETVAPDPGGKPNHPRFGGPLNDDIPF
jgi:hypothetical protein